ncbi:MAG: lytic transglycosylase domain-containing protein [Microbacterium sp.]
MARAATARRAWLLTTLAILLAVGALGAIVVALVLQQSAPDPEPGARSADQAAAPDAGGGDEANAISDRVDPAWVTVTAERLGIPERALAAYAGASLAVVEEYPDCGIGWNTVAAIGEVESIHGTIHGSRIGEDGVAEPAIIGIRLDGTSTQRIPDTDDGVLDGDTEFDRAVGPMQFIPETWRHFARDGAGTGEPDPQNIDDAAMTTAAYLCASGGDLTDGANWIAAVHAYNPTIDYNNRVAEAASRYASEG